MLISGVLQRGLGLPPYNSGQPTSPESVVAVSTTASAALSGESECKDADDDDDGDDSDDDAYDDEQTGEQPIVN